jgi:hypothetical protein
MRLLPRTWSGKCALTAVALMVIAASLFPRLPIRHVVHRVEVKGCPGYFVEFMKDRSLLSVNTGPGYVIVFPGGSEDKHTTYDVPVAELRRDSSAEYDEATLTVYVPRGDRRIVPGWRP